MTIDEFLFIQEYKNTQKCNTQKCSKCILDYPTESAGCSELAKNLYKEEIEKEKNCIFNINFLKKPTKEDRKKLHQICNQGNCNQIDCLECPLNYSESPLKGCLGKYTFYELDFTMFTMTEASIKKAAEKYLNLFPETEVYLERSRQCERATELMHNAIIQALNNHATIGPDLDPKLFETPIAIERARQLIPEPLDSTILKTISTTMPMIPSNPQIIIESNLNSEENIKIPIKKSSYLHNALNSIKIED